jgi:hypothetical protein
MAVVHLPALVLALGRLVAGAPAHVKRERWAPPRVREKPVQLVVLLQQARVLLLELADLCERRGQHRHRVLEIELPQRGLQLCHRLLELRPWVSTSCTMIEEKQRRASSMYAFLFARWRACAFALRLRSGFSLSPRLPLDMYVRLGGGQQMG